MGNGYFRTSQTRKDKRKTKEFTYNYVDRIRLAESSLQDHPNYPVRASGWRHTSKSVSHLDLATSCHSAASGLNHWPAARQLRPSRSLDYNHINRCKDALDIAEYYWRIDPEEHYNDDVGQKSGLHQQCQYKEALYRDYADENYHSTNNVYSSQQQQLQQPQNQQHQQQQQQPLHHTQQQQAQQQQPVQPFDIGNDSCSLRRSRSLAVIREETFSDLQITSTNSGRRRSQLIPRARLVNRGFFREHETRFNCANSKHHHHHHSSREKLANGAEGDLLSNGSGTGTCDSHQHQHHLIQQQQQQHQHHHHHHHSSNGGSAGSNNHHQSREADDYYDNLKRLDSLTVNGVGGEHLHPWHNDKSDLESLNSDYFKNSLHQTHEHKQQQQQAQQQQQQQQLHQQQQQSQQQLPKADATEKTERIDKPRIYQSRRQQRTLIEKHTIQQQAQQQKSITTNVVGGVDSCPENSQSSVFPETTTSNSDDQTDSLSLSEQEYDLTRIEEIFQQTQLDADIDAESYELISLTTTTRTRIETTEEEEDEDDDLDRDYKTLRPHSNEHTSTTDTEIEGTLKRARALSENLEKLIAYDSVYLSSEEGSEGTLIDEHCEEVYVEEKGGEASLLDTEEEQRETTTTSTTLLHISIEDTVFDSPLAIEEDTQLGGDTEEEIANDTKFVELVHKKLAKVQEKREQEKNQENLKVNCDIESQQVASESTTTAIEANPIYTQILKVEHASSKITPHTPNSTVISTGTSAATKPRILAVVEKRKLKRAADTANEVAQRTSVEQSGVSPCLHLTQRPVTDALYTTFQKPNLIDNQYHSLPDVNIGKSLKVSERIDAKLRSSYNLSKNQVNEEEIIDCCVGKEERALVIDNQNNHVVKLRQKEERVGGSGGVTTAEIYDSIKRFGRAHQKARQREYEDLHETVTIVKDKSTEVTREKKQRVENCKDIKAIKHVKVEQFSEKNIPHEKEAVNNLQHEVSEKNGRNEHLNHLDAPLASATENSIVAAETEILDSLSDVNIEEAEEKIKEIEETLQIIETDADYLEQPKEAPSIEVPTFTREIEQRAKEIKQSKAKKKRQRLEEYESETFTSATFRINKSTNNFPESRSEGVSNQFKIIVTDAQNNIIEEDSIEGNHTDNSLEQEKTDKQETEIKSLNQNILKKIEKINLNPQKSLAREKTRAEKSTTVSHNLHHRVSSLKRVPSKPKRLPPATIGTSSQQQVQPKQATNSEAPATIKSKERRVLGTQIYKARPVKVLSSNDSFRRAAAAISYKMSRPQILHVVDNKRSGGGANADTTTCCAVNAAQIEGNQVENEYMKKVDSVRCYWSKLAQSGEDDKSAEEKEKKQQKTQCSNGITLNNNNMEHSTRYFNLGANTTTTDATTTRANKNHPNELLLTTTAALKDEFCSLMPSIEIVELNGEKRATIVSAVPPNSTADTLSSDTSEPQFDHIRYKVMKSQQLIRSNILARNKKEAQFDGLIQYLQEYSFQELLSNNNVVIVEPVRTKIERPLMTTPGLKLGYGGGGGGTTTPSSVSTITEPATTNQFAVKDSDTETLKNGIISPAGSSSATTGTNKQNNAIKRHFFYQPVRVNRELYEEELPNPDTVRNVRRFFEEHILPTPGHGIAVQRMRDGSKQQDKSKQLSPRSRRARKFRYLTIDTSYGHANVGATEAATAADQQQQQQQELPRKWDSASLSSGISSGDLSSPCDCNDSADAAGQQHQNLNNNSKCPEELKGVHVKDFIRRHNTIGDGDEETADDAIVGSSTISKDSKRLLRPRPRSVYGIVGEHSYYRDIYEYNARQGYDANGSNGGGNIYTSRRSDIADGENDMFADDNDDNADGNDIDDDELSESYYVSNDVLEKIRECGSSVTYYGGRVLQRLSPEPHNQYHSSTAATTAAGCGGNNIHNTTTTMTLTRALAKEFETCGGAECQTKECPHSKQMNVEGAGIQKQLTTTVREQKNDTLPVMAMRVQQNNHNNDAYLGVRFKLIKSNSCSSRLELAGAEDDSKHKDSTHMEVLEEPSQQDTEVVKDIIKRLEATRNTASRNNVKHEIRKVDCNANNGLKRDLLHSGIASNSGTGSGSGSNVLTINNQMPVKCDSDIAAISSNHSNNNNTNIKEDVTQVTVNNHINVPISVISSIESLNKATANTPKSMQREKFNNTECETQNNNMEKTYQSSTTGIRLDMPTAMVMPKEKCHKNNNGSNSSQSNSNNSKDNENANGTNTTKICRNKNVDLAFTMTKQQQHTNTFKSTGTTKDNRKAFKTLEQTQSGDIIKNMPVLSHNELKDIMPNVAPSVSESFTPHLPMNHNDKNSNSNSSNNDHKISSLAPDDTVRIMAKSQKNLVENFENAIRSNADKPRSTTTTTTTPATIKQPTTIIVPVEIHQRTIIEPIGMATAMGTIKTNYKSNDLDKTSNLSCCSSSASIDKAFVRHYVANDKSLLENRKYDDIEFEEFEVYDPSKDVEHLNENKVDCSQKQEQQQQEQQQQLLHNKSKTSSISDLSSLNDDKTDCYDSLDDRL